MSIFDDHMAAALSQFEAAFGDAATLNFAAGGPSQAVTVMKITARPRLVPAASADQEYREMEIRISAEAYPSPKALFGGQRADWFTALITAEPSQQWWVIDIFEENDPTTHHLLLRDKQIPKEYAFGG